MAYIDISTVYALPRYTYQSIVTLPWGKILWVCSLLVVPVALLSYYYHWSWPWLVLWTFAPMFCANMAPPGANKLTEWLDWKFDWRTNAFNAPILESWFGKNKTWRGLLAALLAGLTVSVFQYSINSYYTPYMKPFVLPEHGYWLAVGIGLVQGFGAMFGDAVESWFKRHVMKIPPGDPWQPYDQIDCGLGAYVVLLAFVASGTLLFPPLVESVAMLGWLLFSSAVLIPYANQFFHWLRLKAKPY